MVDRTRTGAGEFNYRGLKVDLDSSPPIGSLLYPSQFGDFDLVTFLSLSMHRVGFPLLGVELSYLLRTLQSARLVQLRAMPKKDEFPLPIVPSRRPHVASEIK